MRTREKQVHARALALLERGDRAATGSTPPETTSGPEPMSSRSRAEARLVRERPPAVVVPTTLRDALATPSWTAVAGLVLVLLVVAGVLGVRVAMARAAAQPVAVRPAAAQTVVTPSPALSTTRLAATPAAAKELVVDVAGAVARPGVLRLTPGTRVVDALGRAGGTTPDADLTSVNRARLLVDGELLRIPRRGEVAPPPAPAAIGTGVTPSGAAAAPATGPVDLNTADAAALDALPGIGPALSARILAWRTEHGRFTSVDELGEVSGIGDTLLSRLRPLVRVG